MQTQSYICKCGRLATVRVKATGEWICEVCMVKDICNKKGIDEVYMGRLDDGTLDFFVPLADLLPMHIYWN